MPGARSTVALRRLLPGLLAAALIPAAVFGAFVIAVPGAGASALPAGQAYAAPPNVPPATITPGTSPFPPSAPTDLTATAVTTESVTLSWTASTPGCCAIDGYEITYNQAFNDLIWTQRVGDVTTATIVAYIDPTKQYTFSVAAVDFMGRRSASSDSIVVVVPNTDTGDTTPPSTPPDFAVTVQGATAQLSWSAATDNVGVTAYDVYKFDGLYVSTLLASPTGTSVTVPLGTGRNLFYVRARDAAGNLSIATPLLTVQGPTSPPATPGTCQVTYANTSQWSTGFVAAVTIRNTSPATAINGWTLVFSFQGDQQVTNVWSAQVIQNNATVTARNADWNGTIPAGGSVSFGMQGTWRSSNAPPGSFVLNGISCVVGS